MALESPAPSTIVVLSLSIVTFLALAQVLELDVLELVAEVLGDGLAAGEDRDVFEHRLAAVTEAGGLDGGGLQRATQLVDDEGRQRFAFDVFGDDEQRAAEARHLLEDREEVLHRADLLFVDQDDRVLEHHFHALGVRHEVGREVAAVELHAFDHVQRRLEGLGLFDGDDAVLADLLHRLGDDRADGRVAVGRDGADLGDHVALHGLGHLLDLGRHGLDRLLDAALQFHRVGAGDDVARAFTVDGLGEHRRRRRAVTGRVGRLARDFADHLGAHVLERVLEVDFLRDRHAVLGDGGGAELLVEDHVPALGTEGHLDRVRELVHAAKNRLA